MKPKTAQKILVSVRDDYDAIADSFSDTRSRPWPEMEKFASLVARGDRVLDIGCGNGRMYQLLAEKAISYEGIDVSAGLIRHAQAQWGSVGTLAQSGSTFDARANFRVGSWLALPYPDASFDVVVSIATLHHIPSGELRLTAMREAARVLKPGGFFMMTNWNRWKLAHLENIAETWWRKLCGSGEDWNDLRIPWKRGPERVDRYYHAFTYRELRRLCERAGFTVQEHYPEFRKFQHSRWFERGESMVTICRK